MADEVSQELKISQENRMAVLTTPFGNDVLALTRFDGSEGLSELFEFRIEAVSKIANLDFDQALGQNCSVNLSSNAEGGKRIYNGVLVEGQRIGQRDDLYVYRLVLRPWLWLLTQTSNCKIFPEDHTAVDIITQVFTDAGFSDFRTATQETYDGIPYCVQYRETKFAFVSRMMEEFGIYYYFEHSEEKHILVLSDIKASHSPVPGNAVFDYAPYIGMLQIGENEFITNWTSERRVRTGKVKFRDFNYVRPTSEMTAEAQGNAGYSHADLEIYDYPGRYADRDKGEKLAKIRLTSRQALDKRRYATGFTARLFPGSLFNLARYPESTENKEYLVVRATHSFQAQDYRSGGSGNEPDTYLGTLEVLESTIPFKAPAVTEKPLVYGPHSAIVVDDHGGDPEGYGRVKVRFHWDREPVQSCWARVAQMWAGKGWGTIFIPRIGQEVIVEFLEGDPDQPVVIGALYNGEYEVPYKLPDKKTQSGIKTQTWGGGGYNELRFDDEAGKQELYTRAEKDQKALIRDKETVEIGEDNSSGVAREVTLIKGDDKLTLNQGNISVDVKAGKIDIKAMQSITLTCGQSSIEMTQESITIKSVNITVQAQAALSLKANATAELNGGGMTTIQGGLVKIN